MLQIKKVNWSIKAGEEYVDIVNPGSTDLVNTVKLKNDVISKIPSGGVLKATVKVEAQDKTLGTFSDTSDIYIINKPQEIKAEDINFVTNLEELKIKTGNTYDGVSNKKSVTPVVTPSNVLLPGLDWELKYSEDNGNQWKTFSLTSGINFTNGGKTCTLEYNSSNAANFPANAKYKYVVNVKPYNGATEEVNKLINDKLQLNNIRTEGKINLVRAVTEMVPSSPVSVYVNPRLEGSLDSDLKAEFTLNPGDATIFKDKMKIEVIDKNGNKVSDTQDALFEIKEENKTWDKNKFIVTINAKSAAKFKPNEKYEIVAVYTGNREINASFENIMSKVKINTQSDLPQ